MHGSFMPTGWPASIQADGEARMISTKAQAILLAACLAVGLLVITVEPAPGPQITVIKTKQVDARELIK